MYIPFSCNKLSSTQCTKNKLAVQAASTDPSWCNSANMEDKKSGEILKQILGFQFFLEVVKFTLYIFIYFSLGSKNLFQGGSRGGVVGGRQKVVTNFQISVRNSDFWLFSSSSNLTIMFIWNAKFVCNMIFLSHIFDRQIHKSQKIACNMPQSVTKGRNINNALYFGYMLYWLWYINKTWREQGLLMTI